MPESTTDAPRTVARLVGRKRADGFTLVRLSDGTYQRIPAQMAVARGAVPDDIPLPPEPVVTTPAPVEPEHPAEPIVVAVPITPPV